MAVAASLTNPFDSKPAELFLSEPSLLEDRTKRARRNVARVHRHVSLPSVGVAEDNV